MNIITYTLDIVSPDINVVLTELILLVTRNREAVAVRCLVVSVTLKGKPPAERRAVGWGEAGGGYAHGCSPPSLGTDPDCTKREFCSGGSREGTPQSGARQGRTQPRRTVRAPARIVQNAKGRFVYVGV